MPQRLIPHFSLKALFSSLVVALLTLGVIFLKTSSELKNDPPPDYLKIVLQKEGGQIKFPHQEIFKIAQEGQEVFSGSELKTGENQTLGLKLGNNLIVLNENTQLHLNEIHFQNSEQYIPAQPLLEFALIEGEVGVEAKDSIILITPNSNTNFVQSSGFLTYLKPLNQLEVFKGEVLFSLKKENGEDLTSLAIPLQNKISFVDQQITNDFSVLKPSKLRKELKMTSLKENSQDGQWFEAYLQKQNPSKKVSGLMVNSSLRYNFQSFFQNLASKLNFLPHSAENIAQKQIQLKFAYILGGLTEENDLGATQEILAELKSQLQNDLKFSDKENFFLNTLVNLEDASLSQPAYLLKEFLIEELQPLEGPSVLRVYLADLQNTLKKEDLKQTEAISKKWQKKWTEALIAKNLDEYNRQVQLLHHTLLSNSRQVTLALLDTLDQATGLQMKLEKDKEEIRFEVAQQRLQMTTVLINKYRYLLAKQYLKNSYLSLKMGNSNPDLASTQVFITTGTLLAQHLDYALTSLHGAAQPIDESKFQEYLQKKHQEQTLLNDLKSILEVQEEEGQPLEVVQIPTVLEVKERFEKEGLEVLESNIKPIEADSFYFEIQKASLIKTAQENIAFFSALYDFRTDTLSQVKIGEKDYTTSFVLKDFVNFIKGKVSTTEDEINNLTASVDSLLTNQEKINAQEDQALARDLAIKFAVTQLTEVGLAISDLKSNVEVLDVNMDTMQIKQATLPAGNESPVSVSFLYSTKTKQATDVRAADGTLLLDQVSLADLILKVQTKLEENKKALLAIKDFMTYASKNQLLILEENIHLHPEGYLQLENLELATLGLKVTGLYDPQRSKFISVSHPLLTMEDVDLKEYFEALVDLYIVNALSQKQVQIKADQITSIYPFSFIQLKNIKIADTSFNFSLDINTLQPANIIHLNTGLSLGNMNFQQLKIYVAGLNSDHPSPAISPGSDPQ